MMRRLLKSDFARDVKYFVNAITAGIALAVLWAGYEYWLKPHQMGSFLFWGALFVAAVMNTFIHQDQKEGR
jgi:hypothetical protein